MARSVRYCGLHTCARHTLHVRALFVRKSYFNQSSSVGSPSCTHQAQSRRALDTAQRHCLTRAMASAVTARQIFLRKPSRRRRPRHRWPSEARCPRGSSTTPERRHVTIGMAVRLRAIIAVWRCQPCALAVAEPTRAAARGMGRCGRQSVSMLAALSPSHPLYAAHFGGRSPPCPPSNAGARATARMRAAICARTNGARHDTTRVRLRGLPCGASFQAQHAMRDPQRTNKTPRCLMTPRSVIADAKARGVEPPKADASDELALFKSARAQREDSDRSLRQKGGLGQRQGRSVSRAL